MSSTPTRAVRRISALAAGAAILGLLAPAMTSAQSQPQQSQPGPSVQRFRGFVAPVRRVALMAPLDETLKSVEVREGDRVTAGDVVALLDDDLQQVVVESARLRAGRTATVRLAALDLEEARDNLERIIQAFDRGAATDTELDQARIAALRAEAAHSETLELQDLARVELELEERRLRRYAIRAPFDATVVKVEAESGAMLTAEDPIVILADLSTLEAHLDLPAHLYGQLAVGASFTLVAEAPVRSELAATLSSVRSIIDTASQTFHCVFDIDNREADLPAGFTVELQWPPAVVAPPAAVVTGADDSPR